ncbi:MAG: insulinase family protein [Xanthomonadales bacterium]|nr:insulinase family protein [Xanthomonadales bacterium]
MVAAGRLAPASEPPTVEVAWPTGALYGLRTDTPDAFALSGSFRIAPAADGDDPLLLHLVAALATCGTRHRDEFEIADALERRGATLSLSVEPERVAFAVRGCSADFDALVALLVECLREPVFDAAAFHAERARLIAELQAEDGDPATRADAALSRLLYAPTHARHRPDADALIARLQRCTVEDVRRCHRDHFGATGLRIALVGDLDLDAAAATVERRSGDWPARPLPAWPDSALPVVASPLARIALPEAGYVHAALGRRLALRCDHPDHPALWLANRLLGGGFGSRLVAAVRETRGLTYSIQSQLAKPHPDLDGHWQIDLAVGADSLDAGLAATRDTLARFLDEGASAAELDARRAQAIGAFRIGLATLHGLGETMLFGAERGWGAAHLRTFPERLRAVDLATLNRVLRAHFALDDVRTAIAGP